MENDQEGSQRYGQSVEAARRTGVLWGLRDSDGWMVAGDDEGCESMPVWPSAEAANACATGCWQGGWPEAIPLVSWLDRWTPGLVRDGRKVAVHYLPRDCGLVVEPERFASDLVDEADGP
jgi:hypothetical protein